MKRLLLPLLFLGASALVLDGCKKEPQDTETTSATDNSFCEGEFMRVLPTVNKINIDEPGVHRLGNPGNNNVASTCYTVIFNSQPNQFPLSITVDFGTGCPDQQDGRVRAGKMTTTIDRSVDSIGCVTTIVLDSFYVNGVHFEGTVRLTKLSATSYRKEVIGGKCTKTGTNPWVILWACDRTISLVAGASTTAQYDDIIEVSGTNAGTDRNGKTWSSTITSPLVRDMSCSWLTKGTMELTPEGKATRTIDFGNGSCDNKGTISIEGTSFEFTMN
jgi:hypothetical protein